MRVTAINHVQLAMPRGGEDVARGFYGALLGMAEVEKPPLLAARGGCWFEADSAVIHLGVEEPFAPAKKAHPGLVVDDLQAAAETFRSAGHECRYANDEIPGVERFYVGDPFGNRLEFQQAG